MLTQSDVSLDVYELYQRLPTVINNKCCIVSLFEDFYLYSVLCVNKTPIIRYTHNIRIYDTIQYVYTSDLISELVGQENIKTHELFTITQSVFIGTDKQEVVLCHKIAEHQEAPQVKYNIEILADEICLHYIIYLRVQLWIN